MADAAAVADVLTIGGAVVGVGIHPVVVLVELVVFVSDTISHCKL